ncbi:DUF952 domain-containing protein [Anabaena azotica]|uniref:DUF952 domain-containing protein n=1 Tax=Anabaena azotica TaxID=197653 RepID=UPI0039A6638F
MTTILHLTESQKWQQAKKFESYRCSTLETEGFIHCSLASQVIKSANAFFHNQHDLVLLFIDSAKTPEF